MDSRPKTDPRISANTERSTSSAPGPVKAPRQIISSVGRAKIEQLAPNYSESEVATSTSNSYGGPQYYIDYKKNTRSVTKTRVTAHLCNQYMQWRNEKGSGRLGNAKDDSYRDWLVLLLSLRPRYFDFRTRNRWKVSFL